MAFDVGDRVAWLDIIYLKFVHQIVGCYKLANTGEEHEDGQHVENGDEPCFVALPHHEVLDDVVDREQQGGKVDDKLDDRFCFGSVTLSL